MLDGSKPILLIQRSYQKNSRLPECMGEIISDTGGAIELGFVVGLTWYQPTTVSKRLAEVVTNIRIADPQVFTHSNYPHEERARSSDYPYMASAVSEDDVDDDWLADLLAAQLSVGATVLLAPGFWIGSTDAERQLKAAMQWISASRQIADGHTMVVDLALPGEWLSNDDLRSLLLTEIVESSERRFHLRFHWPVVSPRYGQLCDTRLLEGYGELAHICAIEGKILLLPNTGLTGWFAAGIGASGFSVGTGWNEQAFAESRIIRMPKGIPRPEPINRYFEPQILHTVDLDTHAMLAAQKGYRACTCSYCAALEIGKPRLDPAHWDGEKAGYHYLVQCGRLAAKLNSPQRRVAALKEVKRALQFHDHLPAASRPTGDNVPRHLPLWDQLLV